MGDKTKPHLPAKPSEQPEKQRASKKILDFPGGPVVNNPPSNARGHRFDPWSAKVHML